MLKTELGIELVHTTNKNIYHELLYSHCRKYYFQEKVISQ